MDDNQEQDDNQENQNDDNFGNASDIEVNDITMGGDGEDSNDDNSDDDDSNNDDNSGDDSSSAGDDNSDDSSNDDSNSDDNSDSADDAAGDGSAGGSDDQGESNTNDDQQDDNQNNEYNEEEAYLALSEETGVEVISDEDVVVKLKELASLRKDSGLSSLSPAMQAAIKVEQEGGNLSEHFARVSMDIDKMDTKEALRQQFFKNDAKLYGTNPKLAQMKFERHFNEKYGKWESYNNLTDEIDKKEFLDDHDQESIDYEKMMLENDGALAKEELTAWKESVKPVEKQATEGGMTEKESSEYATKYTAKVNDTLSSFQSVAISMGEGAKDFALGLNDTTRPKVEGWIKNPSTFLKDIGFNGSEIDTERLLPIMTVLAEASVGDLGGKIAKFTVDSDDVETIKKRQDKPNGKTGADSSQDRGDGDEWSQIGDAAEKANETANGR